MDFVEKYKKSRLYKSELTQKIIDQYDKSKNSIKKKSIDNLTPFEKWLINKYIKLLIKQVELTNK